MFHRIQRLLQKIIWESQQDDYGLNAAGDELVPLTYDEFQNISKIRDLVGQYG